MDKYRGASVGVVNAASVAAPDLELLESLVNDSPETFLYGFSQGAGYRFLGARFRTDDGKTSNYQGPLYDIYEVVAPVPVAAGNPSRQKLVYFDSRTKLLAQSRYLIQRGGAKVSVSTEYGGWTNSGGQAFAGQIVRKEDGVVVFRFKITSATVGPAAADTVFPKH